MTWTTISPRSTSTHSASRWPSTPIGGRPAFLAFLTTSSAIDFTCRDEVPLATTRRSVTELLSRTSISRTSRAFRSSSAASTIARSGSADIEDAAGFLRGRGVLSALAGAGFGFPGLAEVLRAADVLLTFEVPALRGRTRFSEVAKWKRPLACHAPRLAPDQYRPNSVTVVLHAAASNDSRHGAE